MRNLYQTKIESFYSQNKRMPSYSEMLKLFNFKSKNAVFKVVEKLMETGFVAKDHLGRLVPSETFGEVPRLGFVTAGFPATVEEELADTVNLDDLLIKNKPLTYMLEVDGEFTLKYFRQKGNKMWLEPANKNYKPIYP